jgi:hypothetical protein
MSKRSLNQDYNNHPVSKRQNIDDENINIFRIKRTQEYEGSFPVYKQPQEINSYSIDHNRHVWFDNREMVIIKSSFFFLFIFIFIFHIDRSYSRNIIIHQLARI